MLKVLEKTCLVSQNDTSHNDNFYQLNMDTFGTRELSQITLAFFGIFWPRMYPSLHFYCSKS